MTKRETSNHDLEDPPTSSLVEPLLPPSSLQELQPPEPAVVLASDPTTTIEVEQALSLDLQDLTFDETAWDHGELQAASFRNVFWAILFLAQIIAMITLAIFAIVALCEGDFPEIVPVNVNSTLLFFLTTIFGITLLSAALILLLLSALSDMMIQVSLVVSPISSGLGSVGALLLGQIGVAIGLAIFCAFGVCYAVGVWHRIPFATANLAIAMAAIHAHKGLFPLAYATTLLATLWALTFVLATVEVSVVHREWVMVCHIADATGSYECQWTTQGKWIAASFLFSLYWTSQVIKNVLHTTIAGVVGTFWFSPAPVTTAGGCCRCDTTIYDSWIRSSFYSFGSICLGSLLVAVLQVLQILVRVARRPNENRNDEQYRRPQGSILFCILQLLVDYLEKLMEYINSWAYVYVGLYGYEYWTAGKKVYQLFRARGWSVILNDHLVSRSLGLMQLFIGILSGSMAVVLGLIFLGMTANPLATFSLGVFLGIILSSIQFQVVTSAVETVMVCFAEAPSALVENHPPELADRMIRAWRVAYPDECGL